MYIFKKELKDELLDGRSVIYVAKKIGISRVWLYKVINAETKTSKAIAYYLVKACNPEAEIKDYFDRVGD